MDLLESAVIDFETGRNIFEMNIQGTEATPRQIVDANNWHLVSDPDKIEAVCVELIARNPSSVKKYKKGKQKSLQTLVNDVANISPLKINLSMVSKRLKEMMASD